MKRTDVRTLTRRQDLNKAVKINKSMALDMIGRMDQDRLLDQVAKNDPFLWIYRNVPNEHGKPLEFNRRPYLKDILQDFSPHIVYKKSAQVGITMCGGIAKCLYALDKLGITGIYTFPTATAVSDFSKARFRNIIHNSRYLSAKIGSIDNQGLVQVGNAFLYFRGASKDTQAISVPSDLNIHDELDFSDESIREIYSARLDASSFLWEGREQNGWEWDFSTPTLPRYGVSALYDDSDQHEWWVRCHRCRRRQRVNFFRNMRTKKKSDRFFGCLKCDKELDRTQGWWDPLSPGARIRGYHITQPMCAYVSAQRMWNQWIQAKKTPEGKRKFYNFNLGLDYEDGTETVTKTLVLSRVVESKPIRGRIYMGVDQGDLLHVVVSKVIDNVRRIIWADTIASFTHLERLIEHYEPVVCVIDSQPNHHNAKYLARTRHNVYACYYTQVNKPIQRKRVAEGHGAQGNKTFPH